MSCLFCGGIEGKHTDKCWLMRLTSLEDRVATMEKEVLALNEAARLESPPLEAEARGLIQQVINEWGPLPADGKPEQQRFYEYKEAFASWNGDLVLAWGLIANAFNGDWNKATSLWRTRARNWEKRWRIIESRKAEEKHLRDIATEHRTVLGGRTVEQVVHEFDTHHVQAAVIAGQGEQLKEIRSLFCIPASVQTLDFLRGFYNSMRKQTDLQNDEINRLKSALETERAVNRKLCEQQASDQKPMNIIWTLPAGYDGPFIRYAHAVVSDDIGQRLLSISRVISRGDPFRRDPWGTLAFGDYALSVSTFTAELILDLLRAMGVRKP